MKYVWHAKRFWVQKPTGNQHLGWNTDFEGCPVFKKSAKRVGVLSPSLGILWLNREFLERDGKVYHSKPHEWFYAVRPAVDPERSKGYTLDDLIARIRGDSSALVALGLQSGATQADIKRAYKRLAKKVHPDHGGDHESFIRLKNAYESAMRLA